MMSNPNQGTSTPHFAWFHPGNYLAALRNGFNPIQATQTKVQGTLAIPIDEQPPNNIDGRPVPTKSSKKPKTTSNVDGLSKELKLKISKKGSGSTSRKNLNFPSRESNMDSSGIPSPFCSCTGVPRQCYRWGGGGWQSSCCTTYVSAYPLPMSTTRPGSRIGGRKMSHRPYDKVLQKLEAEGYDFSQPIDLKHHWAKHGSNKYVIKK